MAPTNPHAPPQPVEHKAVVTAAPPGQDTFGVECMAGDFFASEVFPTKQAAEQSDAMKTHLAAFA